MKNRLRWEKEETREPTPEDDFWEVWTESGQFYVSEAAARKVMAEIGRSARRGWISFKDLSGSEVNVPGRSISQVSESTRAQRDARRQFNRARREERKADRRPWEEDDWW